jgi:thiaminase
MKNADHLISSAHREDGAIAALHKEFIPNWTSEQFGDFVKDLAFLADAWANKSDTEDVQLSTKFWTRVVMLEARFWPDV